MRHFLELASASRNVAWFVTPLMETAVSVDLNVEVASDDAGEELTVTFDEAVDSEQAKAVVMEMLDTIGVSTMSDVDLTTEDASVKVKLLWTPPGQEIARPIDPEADLQYDDDPDDDEEEESEDEDETDDEGLRLEKDEDGDKIPAGSRKKQPKKGLSILNNVEARKLLERLYTMISGEDVSHFPDYWQAMDRLADEYRGRSGYKPKQDQETASIDEADIEAFLVTAYAEGVEYAKAQKKWKEGYSGFLTAFMRAVAAKRGAIEKLWNTLDDAAMVEMMIKIGNAVVQAIVNEREARGMDDSSDEGDDSSDIVDPSAEEATGDKQFHVLVEYKTDTDKWEKIGENFNKENLNTLLEEKTKEGVKRQCMGIHTLPNSKQESMNDLLQRLNEDKPNLE